MDGLEGKWTIKLDESGRSWVESPCLVKKERKWTVLKFERDEFWLPLKCVWLKRDGSGWSKSKEWKWTFLTVHFSSTRFMIPRDRSRWKARRGMRGPQMRSILSCWRNWTVHLSVPKSAFRVYSLKILYFFVYWWIIEAALNQDKGVILTPI